MSSKSFDENSESNLSASAMDPSFLRVFFFLLVIILGWRIFLLDLPVHWDTGVYSVVSHELHRGQRLYTDVFDHKPPGIHVTFWLTEWIVGYGFQMLLLLGVGFTFMALTGVCSAASSFQGGHRMGLWAAIFWTVISADLWTAANQVNTDMMINALGIWTLAILLRSDDKGLSNAGRWTVGIFWAVGSVYKQIMIAPAVLLSLAHLLHPPTGCSRLSALRDVLVWLFTGVALWIFTIGWFYFDGRFADFWVAVFTYNSWYSGSLTQNLLAGLFPANWLRENLLGLAPLMLLSLPAVLWVPWWRSLNRKQLLFLAYGISCWIMVCLPGKFFSHYYQLMIPVFCVLSAFVVVRCGRLHERLPTIIGSAVVVILMALQFYGLDQFNKRGTLYREDPYLVKATVLADWVDSLLEKDETFYVWGGRPELYFYTKRSPAVGMFYMIPGSDDRYPTMSFTKFKQDFSSRPPELLIVNTNHWGDHEVYRWIVPQYSPLNINATGAKLGPFKLMYLNGGALEQRIRSASTAENHSSNDNEQMQ